MRFFAIIVLSLWMGLASAGGNDGTEPEKMGASDLPIPRMRKDTRVKPGTCPIPTGPGICEVRCSNDNDCNDTLKCCSTGCGHKCIKPADEPACKIGIPLQNENGTNFFCGRGGERCPCDFECVIHPTDIFAVCCNTEPACKIGIPLQNENGTNFFCGRGGERCPSGFECVIHPTDIYAVCCNVC